MQDGKAEEPDLSRVIFADRSLIIPSREKSRRKFDRHSNRKSGEAIRRSWESSATVLYDNCRDIINRRRERKLWFYDVQSDQSRTRRVLLDCFEPGPSRNYAKGLIIPEPIVSEQPETGVHFRRIGPFNFLVSDARAGGASLSSTRLVFAEEKSEDGRGKSIYETLREKRPFAHVGSIPFASAQFSLPSHTCLIAVLSFFYICFSATLPRRESFPLDSPRERLLIRLVKEEISEGRLASLAGYVTENHHRRSCDAHHAPLMPR